jgi:hypothetical protein
MLRALALGPTAALAGAGCASGNGLEKPTPPSGHPDAGSAELPATPACDDG